MKKIIDTCFKYNKNMNNHNQFELIKLRLRGKGSGYREGPAKLGIFFFLVNNILESCEPLHICVSSIYYEIHKLACKQVENLLLLIYEEYQIFKKLKNPLLIKKFESPMLNNSIIS